MRARALFAALWAAAVAAPAIGQAIEIRPDKAVVYDGNGQPLLIGEKDWLFVLAGNDDHRAFAIDAKRQLVRISRDGSHQHYWLDCADLRGGAALCTRPSAGGAIRTSGPVPTPITRGSSRDPRLLERLPDCPGDPRCPQ